MRPLTNEETKKVFEKLSKYIGRNIKLLIDRKDEEYCFRLNNQKLYYISKALLKVAICTKRDDIASAGVCFGKFTHHGKFRLSITCLDFLAQYAKYKVWVKPSSEMSFLYGNHIVKTGLGRITEDTPRNQGVVIFSMSDIPLGFGTTAQSTAECRHTEPAAIVVYHQSDVGDYLRDEDNMA